MFILGPNLQSSSKTESKTIMCYRERTGEWDTQGQHREYMTGPTSLHATFPVQQVYQCIWMQFEHLLEFQLVMKSGVPLLACILVLNVKSLQLAHANKGEAHLDSC